MTSIYENASASEKADLLSQLRLIGELHSVSSNSSTISLNSKAMESAVSRALGVKNLAGDDTAIDTLYGKVGVGLKTFMASNSPLSKPLLSVQKIAEFKKLHKEISGQPSPIALAKRVSEARNERLKLCKLKYGVTSFEYFLAIRYNFDIYLCKHAYDLIDMSNISVLSNTPQSVTFTDGLHTYRYTRANNTLMQEFKITSAEVVDTLEIKNIATFDEIAKKLNSDDEIDLPFAPKGVIYEKSGINSWNAGGRPRDKNECYLGVPSSIHQMHPRFFPTDSNGFDVKFSLTPHLPSGKKKSILVKICSDGRKQLMSDPNQDLGKLILRTILGLKEGELCTLSHLKKVNVSGVRIIKRNSVYTLEVLTYDV